jgi:hypothetical protein
MGIIKYDSSKEFKFEVCRYAVMMIMIMIIHSISLFIYVLTQQPKGQL